MATIMRCFVMNSIDMFGKFYEFLWVVMNSYGNNHKYFIKFCDYIMNQKLIL